MLKKKYHAPKEELQRAAPSIRFKQSISRENRSGGSGITWWDSIFLAKIVLFLLTNSTLYVLFFMQYEYDPEKSLHNKTKHGIDFEETQALWRDEHCLSIPAYFRGEDRFAMIGRIDAIMWTAIYTMREESIRLISCRRSRKEEADLYDCKKINKISAKEFDHIFDEGNEDITPYLDLNAASRSNLAAKRVSVDVPAWMVQAIDRQADKIGVSRQAFIKFTLHEKLEAIRRGNSL